MIYQTALPPVAWQITFTLCLCTLLCGCDRSAKDNAADSADNLELTTAAEPVELKIPDSGAVNAAAAANNADGPSHSQPQTMPGDTDGTPATQPETPAKPNLLTIAAAPATPQEPSAAQLRDYALSALEQGDDDVAFEAVRQVNRLAPDHPESIFLHALVLGDRHRYHEAIKILDDLSIKTPATRLPSLGQTAEWMVLAGNYNEAEARYRAILAEAPRSEMVHHHLGKLLLKVGKRNDAPLHFNLLAQIGSLDQLELRSLIRLSKPFPQDANTVALEPLTPLAKAQAELSRDQKSEALAILESVDVLSDAEASLLARIRATEKDFDAVKSWAEKHQITAKDADGWFATGCLALNENDSTKAIQCFSKTLLINATDAEAYEFLSKSLLAAGDDATAKEAKTRAKLLRRSQELGAALAINDTNDRPLIAELVKLLKQLNRPLEMYGWINVDLVHAVTDGTMTEPQAQAAFEEMGRQRQQVVQAGNHIAAPSFILCGLSVDNVAGSANNE
ncbi:tetratricopeptide repeat protein [Planctomycetes bacterium K23_9]|uniref:Tetratricopeptide repeat protein n=1 Tax=Stieleria marina TaxID=1930275 RepID=A0A517NT50_9BACT|nr:Tetratricopeptide repeat protein [Planctomycetes bacterium K23_9]